MPDPGLARLGIGRLLPPAAALDEVDPAVAVDVAVADAVREPLIIIAPRRDGMKHPGLIGLGRVVGGVAQAARLVVDQLRPAVAVDVGPHRRLVAHVFQGQMFLPRPVFAGGILVPVGLAAGKRHVENIGPAVAVEVAGEGEEDVRNTPWDRTPWADRFRASSESRGLRTSTARRRHPNGRPC